MFKDYNADLFGLYRVAFDLYSAMDVISEEFL
jgi:hypothetical protein